MNQTQIDSKIIDILNGDKTLELDEMEFYTMVQANMGHKKFLQYYYKLINGVPPTKTKKMMVFATYNWDEKMVTPTGTVNIVQKLLDREYVTKAVAYWEWRNPEQETGLHTHVCLQGDTRLITQYLKRQKGPHTPFIKNELKLYPIKYWDDKVDYSVNTWTEEKNSIKEKYPELRKKYNLPALIK